MRYFLLIIFSVLLGQMMAQVQGLYPDQFTSYFYNQSLVNVAYIPDKNTSEMLVQSKIRSGVYSDINTLTASAQKTFQTSDKKWHSGRLSFFNEKEGPYISIPRLYANYGLRIRTGKDLYLSGGVALGLVNPNYNTPNKTIEVTLPDGSIGGIVSYKKSSLGINCNQVFNNTSDLNMSIRLKRYYNIHFSNLIPINPFWSIKVNMLYRYFSDIKNQLFLSSSVCYNEQIEVGASYQLNRGMSFYSSLKIEKNSQHPLLFAFTYNTKLLDNSAIPTNSYEVSVVYFY